MFIYTFFVIKWNKNTYWSLVRFSFSYCDLWDAVCGYSCLCLSAEKWIIVQVFLQLFGWNLSESFERRDYWCLSCKHNVLNSFCVRCASGKESNHVTRAFIKKKDQSIIYIFKKTYAHNKWHEVIYNTHKD